MNLLENASVKLFWFFGTYCLASATAEVLRHGGERGPYLDFRVLSKLCGAELDDKGPYGNVDPILFLRERTITKDAQSYEPLISLSIPLNDFDNKEKDTASSEPDMRFDWQEKGAVSSVVHDQGSLGTCAAFAVTGNIEGQRALHGDGKMETLSVEQIIECSADADDKNDMSNCGVFGGWPKLALEYVKKRGGIAADSDWPYCAGTLDANLMPLCFPCMPQGYSRKGCDDHDDDFYCNAESTIGQKKNNGWCNSSSFRPRVTINEVLELSDSENEEILVQHLKEHGPLAVALSIGPLQFYRRGILDPPALVCARTGRPDHVALLTGYGVENGKQYWRLKNSWGAAWGEKGYFRLRRGKNACGIGRFQVATAKGIRTIHQSPFLEEQEATTTAIASTALRAILDVQ